MNSCERVKAALTCNKPDKVPVWKAGLGDVFSMVMLPPKSWQPGYNKEEEGLFPHAVDDIVIKLGVWKWNKPDWAKLNPAFRGKKWLKCERYEIDECGGIWYRDGNNFTMGHPAKPFLTDWKDLDNYLENYTPDLNLKDRYSLFLKLSKLAARKKYRLALLYGFGPLMMASNLVGFTKFIIDHRKHPNEIRQLLNHFTELQIKSMDMWIKFGGKPHGFLLVEDLGEQSGPFFSPKMFQQFYEPVYRKLYEAAHERGCDIFQHCCGKIDKILPLLVDWGLDAIELDSPRMTGYVDLKPFVGKLMIWGCVNIQSIYTSGTLEECEREVWHMVRNLGTPDGGFGAYFYPQAHHIQAPKVNVKAFKRGLKKYGVYKKIPAQWWQQSPPTEWKDNIVPVLPKF